MLQSVVDVGDSIKPLTTAALGEAEKLGHQVRGRRGEKMGGRRGREGREGREGGKREGE